MFCLVCFSDKKSTKTVDVVPLREQARYAICEYIYFLINFGCSQRKTSKNFSCFVQFILLTKIIDIVILREQARYKRKFFNLLLF